MNASFGKIGITLGPDTTVQDSHTQTHDANAGRSVLQNEGSDDCANENDGENRLSQAEIFIDPCFLKQENPQRKLQTHETAYAIFVCESFVQALTCARFLVLH
jgi:hypothetical protein